jgi:hypothetical protein
LSIVSADSRDFAGMARSYDTTDRTGFKDFAGMARSCDTTARTGFKSLIFLARLRQPGTEST